MQGYDRFAYVNNNPMRYTDPTGHDPVGNCHDKGYCNDKETWSSIVHPRPVVILACGRDLSCKHGTSGSLDLYEGISPNVYRVPLDGIKYDSASNIQTIANAYPSSPVIIVGHSAGGDAATLAYSNLSDTQKQQTKLILLDPTMTAGTHDPAHSGEIDYSVSGSMSSLLQNSAASKDKVFVYDSDPDVIDLRSYGFNENASNYTYVFKSGIQHMDMANVTSNGIDIFNYALSVLGLTAP